MDQQNDQTVVITGGTGGIGFHSALGIAQTGARVLVTGRNRERGEEARARLIEESGHDHVDFVTGDLSSTEGIDALAEALMERAPRIHVLVNNAGYLGNEPRTSPDGLEMHFAVNVLGPWRLTHALLPALDSAGGARVVNVTGGDKPAAIDVENLQAEKGFRGLMTYTHSKSVMESMSLAMADRLFAYGVSVNVVFPGRASTNMTRSMKGSALPGAMKLMLPFFRLFFAEDGGRSAAKAARSTIWAATTADLKGISGRYYDTHSREQSFHPTAYDATVQKDILAALDLASGTNSA